MEEVKYPYLGTRKYKDSVFVVLFLEKNYGVVVLSEITDVEELKFGHLGDFSEAHFTYLPSDQCVRLNN